MGWLIAGPELDAGYYGHVGACSAKMYNYVLLKLSLMVSRDRSRRDRKRNSNMRVTQTRSQCLMHFLSQQKLCNLTTQTECHIFPRQGEDELNYWKSKKGILRWNCGNGNDSQSLLRLLSEKWAHLRRVWINIWTLCWIADYTYTDLELKSSVTFSSSARNCLSKGTSAWPDSEKTNSRVNVGSTLCSTIVTGCVSKSAV